MILTPISFISDIQYVIPAGIHARLSCLTPFGLMQICSRQICAGIQKPGMVRFDHIHVAWIPAVHAGMTSYFYGYE